MGAFFGFVFKTIGLLTFFATCILAGLLYFAGYWLPVEGAPKQADAIAVLGGSYTRPFHAADLYHKGYAPLVFVSRVYRPRDQRMLDGAGVEFPRQEVVMAHALLKRKVPRKAIHFYGKDNMSTMQEAEALAQRLPEGTSVLVVTSPYHVRRARLIFDKAAPGLDVTVLGSPYEPMPTQWWTDMESAYAVVLETAKFAWFLAGGAFRST